MSNDVKRRQYNAPRRKDSAERTRARLLRTAYELFLERGYAGTTMAAIAEGADVALDTVYAVVGRKPAIFRLLLETSMSGTTDAVPALERDYVRAMQAEPDPRKKLEIYASAIRQVQERLAPLIHVLQQAASQDPELDRLWSDIVERRARNMRLLAADLQSTGGLRPDLTLDEVADIIWATNAPEFYLLLIRQRGWSPERFETWLADAWKRLLLA